MHSPSQQELLTQQFYDWEKRGRGWQVWNYPVELEPPFRPFFFHYVPRGPTIDDARRPGLVRSLIDGVKGYIAPSSSDENSLTLYDTEPENPVLMDSPLELVELAIALPTKQVVNKEAAEHFLLGLSYATYPISLEIIGQPDSITVQMTCREPDRLQLCQQLQAYFPEAVLTERHDFLRSCWKGCGYGQSAVVDFGLSNEFMLPLRTTGNFNVDPLIAVIGSLNDLEENEVGVLQVMFEAARYPWAESILRAVTDWDGKAFFSDAPAMLALAKEKITRPLYAAVIRVGVRSHRYDRCWQLAKALGGTLAQFSSPTSNELIPLSNDGYLDSSHEEDLLSRQTHRSGMILNLDELISLIHPPSASVRSEKLKREEKKTRAAPAVFSGHQLLLGENLHAGKTVSVSLTPEARLRHTYVIGASGTGKSTFLLNLIIQDLQAGHGIAVLDPHGDLIDKVLGYIPDRRLNDVILIDPSDEEYPVGFNILSARSELEKNVLASDLAATFRRLSTSWGDQMTSVLGNAILAMLDSTDGGTLVDLRRFLVEPEFRAKFLKTVKDPEVVYYWQREFPLLTGKPQAPLLTRLDIFLRPKIIRNMISQKEDRLDFRRIMDQGKIFLAKLAQGTIGEENAYLLGTLIVSKLHQMAMSRQEVEESKRPDFFLYIDEFHNFITPSMASILSGARKYHLGLILAHQELRQLWSRDADVASAVISNPYTRICFRLGDFDAQKLKEGFSFFESRDLQNLGIGEAIARIERAEYDFNLRTLPLPVTDSQTAGLKPERIAEHSRKTYARKREEVEAERAQQVREEPVSAPPPKPKMEPRVEQLAHPAPQPEPEPIFKGPPAYQTKKSKTGGPKPEIPTGRGGSQHKYLQQLIKRLAEDKGYRVVIEKEILAGSGSVDASLEKAETRIACEISVSTTAEHELGNVQKCLAAGYDRVILISSEKKDLNKLKKHVAGNLDEIAREKVSCLLPEEFIAHLEELEAQAAGSEQTIKGYRVKVKFKPVGEQEKKTRKEAISKVILNALKRVKK